MSERFYERRHVLGVNGLLSMLVDGYRAKRNLEKRKIKMKKDRLRKRSYRAWSKLLRELDPTSRQARDTNDTEYRYPLR